MTDEIGISNECLAMCRDLTAEIVGHLEQRARDAGDTVTADIYRCDRVSLYATRHYNSTGCQMATYDSLGTRWMFRRDTKDGHTVYLVDTDKMKFRIAPDNIEPSKWRIDYWDGVWTVFNSEKYDSPNHAAADLVVAHS